MPDPMKTFYDAASAVETSLGFLEDTLTALELWCENVEREVPACEPVEDWAAIHFVARLHKYLAQCWVLLRGFRAQLDVLEAADKTIYEAAFKERKEKEENPNAKN